MRYAIALLTLLAAACGSPTSPSGQTEMFEWTVNGQAFAAGSNGRGALRAGSATSLTGANCGSGAIFGIQIGAVAGPGVYSVASNGVTATWTPDARTGDAAGENWSAPGTPRIVGGVFVPGGGSGTVTISSISSDWISGSFSLVVAPSPTNRDTAMKTVQGTFELSFRERAIC